MPAFHYSTQSAINTFVSPAFSSFRLKAKTSYMTPRENIGQAFDVLAVDIHRIQLEIAVTLGRENYLFAVGRNSRFGVIAGAVGQVFDVLAIGCRGIDVVIRVYRPDIAFRIIRGRRALLFP